MKRVVALISEAARISAALGGAPGGGLGTAVAASLRTGIVRIRALGDVGIPIRLRGRKR